LRCSFDRQPAEVTQLHNAALSLVQDFPFASVGFVIFDGSFPDESKASAAGNAAEAVSFKCNSG